MNTPFLSCDERQAINSGRWFAGLSAPLKHDIFRCAYVERYRRGDLIVARGEQPEAWMGCAKGSVRVGNSYSSSKHSTLSYLEPGAWFGEVAILGGNRHSHDVYAHGACTVMCVGVADFKNIMAHHTELCEALLRRNARQTLSLYHRLEDLCTLPLRLRLAKQLLQLARRYGVPSYNFHNEVRIGIHLAQESLAQLLGASRQRVNMELKAMERDQLIRIHQEGLILRDHAALLDLVGHSAAEAMALAA
jgi:CRP/FNR family cyclic AMP-dependent transcriptional regulator